MSKSALVFGSSWVVRIGIEQVLQRIELNVVADGDDFASVNKDAVTEDLALVIGLAMSPYDPDRFVDDMRMACATYPRAPQVMIASVLTPQSLDDAIRAGADGLLGLTMPSKLLLSSIELIVHGHRLYPGFSQRLSSDTNEPGWCARPLHADVSTATEELVFPPRRLPSSPPIARMSESHPVPPSEREWEILNCLALGGSNKAIARELGIAETTVKVHVRSLLRKLRLANRTQVALWVQSNNRPGPSLPHSPAR